MPEAYARSRPVGVSLRARPLRYLWSWLRSFPPTGYAGAALSALVVGILVNALALQKEKQVIAPAPIAARTAPVEAAPAAVQPAVQAPMPPVRSAVAAAEPAPAAAPHVDGIGSFLRTDAKHEPNHPTGEAQAALIKLGYPVRGEAATSSAMVKALQDFERTHDLPVTKEADGKTLKQLKAAVAAAAH